MKHTITQRRVGNRIEFLTSTGSVVATLFDGRTEIVFDPLADVFAFWGCAPVVATKEHFDSIGLTVQNIRAAEVRA